MADRKQEDINVYDAYVCHSNSEKDRTVINHITDILEQTPHNIRLCLPERDMSDVTDDVERSQLIQIRCKRLMVMLSSHHTEDSIRHVLDMAGISSNFSSSSNRIVPVVIENPYNIPGTLQHLITCDYTREVTRLWFFSRLAKSLRHG